HCHASDLHAFPTRRSSDLARLILDWLPNSSLEQINAKLQQPRKGMSFANVLRKKLHLPPLAGALLKECCPHLDPNDSQAVAAALDRKSTRLNSSHVKISYA